MPYPFSTLFTNQGEGIMAGLARSGPSRQPPLPKHPKQGQMEGVRGAMLNMQGLLEGARGEVTKTRNIGKFKNFLIDL